MLNKKIKITLIVSIAACLVILTGIKVQEYIEQQRVLNEAQKEADKERKIWKKEGERTIEQIKKDAQPSFYYDP